MMNKEVKTRVTKIKIPSQKDINWTYVSIKFWIDGDNEPKYDSFRIDSKSDITAKRLATRAVNNYSENWVTVIIEVITYDNGIARNTKRYQKSRYKTHLGTLDWVKLA